MPKQGETAGVAPGGLSEPCAPGGEGANASASVAERRQRHYVEAERWLATAVAYWDEIDGANPIEDPLRSVAAAKIAELHIMLGDRIVVGGGEGG